MPDLFRFVCRVRAATAYPSSSGCAIRLFNSDIDASTRRCRGRGLLFGWRLGHDPADPLIGFTVWMR